MMMSDCVSSDPQSSSGAPDCDTPPAEAPLSGTRRSPSTNVGGPVAVAAPPGCTRGASVNGRSAPETGGRERRGARGAVRRGEAV